MFDRAEIFRSAHRATRARMAPSSSFRYDPETRGWVPKASYREIFASCLRSAWANAKFAAEKAAYEASLPPIPADIAERIRELRAEAEFEPITMRGTIATARCSPRPERSRKTRARRPPRLVN